MGTDTRAEQGFTLAEVLVALFLTSFCLLALGQTFAFGVTQVGSSQADLVAREKAAEAIESVYSARDTRTITWVQLRNIPDGGIFQAGPQMIRNVGADGLVNTADDGAVQTIVRPGVDNLLGTADDEIQPLSTYRRTIAIVDIGPNLRRIQVTVSYQVGSTPRAYTVTALISSFA